MMKPLTRQDLFSLEQYSERRSQIRKEVIAHKQNRQINLGEHLRLLFEDRLTIQYQVQEMLRAERIFETAGIQEELDAYNPLIPDGDNWKATLLIEYEDVAARRVALERLKDVENHIYAKIDGEEIYAIADEDLERSNDTKTSSVHFLRFQLDAAAAAKLRAGAALSFGVNHPHCELEAALGAAQRQALLADLD
jgi:hypothetical protein